jgi:predicted Na+-dependent transporter
VFALLRFFSLPIGIGIVLGLAFPYYAMSLIWLSSLLLILLLFLNTLAVDKNKLKTSLVTSWPQMALALVLIFVLVPVLQTALALTFLNDRDFVFGVVVSSLAPCALINPFFAQYRRGDTSLALLTVIISSALCPLLTVPMLHVLGMQTIYLDSSYMLVFLSTLTTLPVVVSLGVSSFFPGLARSLNRFLPYNNSWILALLMFILVGSALPRVPLRLLVTQDLGSLFFIFIIADFGLFILVRYVGRLFLNPSQAETLAISVATRNFAVSAGLMLVFHPKAALPSACGLIVHCAYFQWLLCKRN